MKTIISKFRLILALGIFAFTGNTLQAQDTNMGDLLNSKKYVFKAEMALPTGMPSRQLTTGYQVQVNDMGLRSELPYFGRATAPPINPSENALDFSSSQFDHQVSTGKDRWEVTITPKDATDVRNMQLTVFSNGRATLQVNSNRRMPISFNGYVQPYGGR